MALFHFQSRKQLEAILSGEHWQLFPPFQSRPLYHAIVDQLNVYVDDKNELNSSWAGSEILSRLESQSPELFQNEVPELVGWLFGMTLWHYLALQTDRWYYVPRGDETEEAEGKFYFRQA